MEKEIILKSHQEKLREWLQSIGVFLNYFEKVNAENEEEDIEEYYVFHEEFRKMTDNHSTVLYAESGGGKTATFLMVQKSCIRGDYTDGKIFYSVINDFEKLINTERNDFDPPTAKMFVDVILQNALPKILVDILTNCERYQYTSENLPYLKQLVRCSPDSLENFEVKKTIENTGTSIKRIKDSFYYKKPEELSELIPPDFYSRVILYIDLLKESLQNGRCNDTATEILQNLLTLIRHIRYDNVFILVDNIDGHALTTDKPEACARLIENVLDNRPLMKLNGIYFKFFFPKNMKKVLEERFEIFRSEHVQPIVVDWSKERLKEIITERLIAATKESQLEVQSLDILCDYNVKGKIERLIIDKSRTPKDIVSNIKRLFDIHARYLPERELIQEDEVNCFIEKSHTCSNGINTKKIEIVICHVIEDQTEVDEIFTELKKHGHKAWIGLKDNMAGVEWKQSIKNKIETSDYVLPVFSNNSGKKSSFFHNEIKIIEETLNGKPPGAIFCIPILLNPNTAPKSFRRLQYVKYYEDKNEAIKKIFKTIDSSS